MSKPSPPSKRPSRAKKIQLHVLLTRAELLALRAAAEEEKRTISGLIRSWIAAMPQKG